VVPESADVIVAACVGTDHPTHVPRQTQGQTMPSGVNCITGKSSLLSWAGRHGCPKVSRPAAGQSLTL
jgi:hypothetical protein